VKKEKSSIEAPYNQFLKKNPHLVLGRRKIQHKILRNHAVIMHGYSIKHNYDMYKCIYIYIIIIIIIVIKTHAVGFKCGT